MPRRLHWSVLILLTACVVCPISSRADEADQTWIHGVFTGHSPRPVILRERDAWHQASDLVERTPGAFVLVGSGDSMRPLYQPGTILVLQQRPYAKLERGQTAIYRNREHRTVAHVLIAKARDGWRVAGLNNRTHDMEPVVAQNLVGIVIAAFAPQNDRAPAITASGD